MKITTITQQGHLGSILSAHMFSSFFLPPPPSWSFPSDLSGRRCFLYSTDRPSESRDSAVPGTSPRTAVPSTPSLAAPHPEDVSVAAQGSEVHLQWRNCRACSRDPPRRPPSCLLISTTTALPSLSCQGINDSTDGDPSLLHPLCSQASKGQGLSFLGN